MLHGERFVRKNARRWTNEERTLFADVLVDKANNFLITIEKLASKFSPNDEVFGLIKIVFDAKLQLSNFKELNESNNFKDKQGNIIPYEKLDTSVSKLRAQLKNMKTKWKEIHERACKGSSQPHKEKPVWYQLLNAVFSETNEELNLIGTTAPSFLLNHDSHQSRDYELEDEDITDSDNDSMHVNSFEPSMRNIDTKKNENHKSATKVHTKGTPGRSNTQALFEIAKSLQSLAEVQTKRIKLTIEAEERREERERQYRREEAEKNRQHELKIAEIYARAFSCQHINIPPVSSQHISIDDQATTEILTPSREIPSSPPPHYRNFGNSLYYPKNPSNSPPFKRENQFDQ